MQAGAQGRLQTFPCHLIIWDFLDSFQIRALRGKKKKLIKKNGMQTLCWPTLQSTLIMMTVVEIPAFQTTASISDCSKLPSFCGCWIGTWGLLPESCLRLVPRFVRQSVLPDPPVTWTRLSEIPSGVCLGMREKQTTSIKRWRKALWLLPISPSVTDNAPFKVSAKTNCPKAINKKGAKLQQCLLDANRQKEYVFFPPNSLLTCHVIWHRRDEELHDPTVFDPNAVF